MGSINEEIHATIRDALRDELRVLRESLTETRASANDDLVKVKVAAQKTGYCDATIHRWIKKGLLPKYGTAHSRRVRLSELYRLLAEGGGSGEGLDKRDEGAANVEDLVAKARERRSKQ